MNLEIVAHCVHYAKLLSFQLSSLVLHPPRNGHAVKYTLCYTAEDEATNSTRKFFADFSPSGVTWNWLEMPRRSLNRRAIGRNQAALATTADWVWFIDVDHCFGSGCLDQLAELVDPPPGQLVYPPLVRATTREGGDRLLAETPTTPGLREVPATDWTEKVEYRRAIGGVQIARGDTCRQLGYLRDHPRWQRGADTWQGCREDPAYRRALGTPGQPIPLEQIFRIRHTAKGRNDPTVRL